MPLLRTVLRQFFLNASRLRRCHLDYWKGVALIQVRQTRSPFPSLLALKIYICCFHLLILPFAPPLSISTMVLAWFKLMDRDLELIHDYIGWNSGRTLPPHPNPLSSSLALRRCRPRGRGRWANHGLCLDQHRWTYLAKHQSFPSTY